MALKKCFKCGLEIQKQLFNIFPVMKILQATTEFPTATAIMTP